MRSLTGPNACAASLLCLASLLAASFAAGECIDYGTVFNPLGTGTINFNWDGQSAAASGDRVCVLSGARLSVFDRAALETSSGILPLGQIDILGVETRGIAISGDHAYVTTSLGLRIVSISDPHSPVEVGAVTDPGSTTGIDISAGRAYLACNSGLVIYDLSNPDAPAALGSLPFGYSEQVSVEGSTACITTGEGLKIVDVSNPASPALLASLPVSLLDVDIDGDYAFGVGGSNTTEGNFGFLSIYDIRNPASPVPVSTAEFDDASALRVEAEGSTAYLLVSFGFMLGEGTGLRVMDVTDREHPSEFTTVLDGLGDWGGLCLDADRVYYAKSTTVFAFADGIPLDPLLGTVPASTSIAAVAAEGSRACVLDWNGTLKTVDVADPSHPAALGDVSVGNGGDVAMQGDFAYVGFNNSPLQIVDISNLAAPALAGSVSSVRYVQDLQVRGAYLYVARGVAGLSIVNVSNPSSPVVTGTQPTPCPAYGVDVAANYAYVAADCSLLVVDVRNPSAPLIAGRLGVPARRVAVSGGTAVVTEAGAALRVVDLSDPTNPVLRRTLSIPQTATAVRIAGSYAYASLSAGFAVVDISDAANAFIVACWSVDPASGRRIAVSENAVLVADGTGGLIAYPLQCASPVSVPAPLPARPGLSIRPNPARNGVIVTFTLPAEGDVCARVFDVAGRQVRSLFDGWLAAGHRTLFWNANDDAGRRAASGTYWIRLTGAGGVRTSRLVLLGR